MFKLIKTNILNASVSGLAVVERELSCFNTEFHSHPAYELVYVKRGRGRRVIGASMENFNDGELILIGSDLPHVWVSEKEMKDADSSSLVLYFKKEIFGGCIL
ncbi:AraC family ligand binding domain-containing protein [Niabella sp. W65]|nr:AraC family ligand binding domain-containing protein [Niabella sp. W65]MCH7363567.1 AraC family ligand binding domain-containing protein [Niabella sp. W65]ULT39482.1 AraC family ligand binding domain-containing protein [Niabella sp. I65]